MLFAPVAFPIELFVFCGACLHVVGRRCICVPAFYACLWYTCTVAVREVPEAMVQTAARPNEPMTSAAARLVSIAVSCVPLRDYDNGDDTSSNDDRSSSGSSSGSDSNSSDSSDEDKSSSPNQHHHHHRRRRRRRRSQRVSEHVYESAAVRKARASLVNLPGSGSSSHGQSMDGNSSSNGGGSGGSGLGVELFFEAASASEAEHFALAVNMTSSMNVPQLPCLYCSLTHAYLFNRL